MSSDPRTEGERKKSKIYRHLQRQCHHHVVWAHIASGSEVGGSKISSSGCVNDSVLCHFSFYTSDELICQLVVSHQEM